MKTTKTEQLQIRVSREEKARIKQSAKRANLPMSDWVLSKLIPSHQQYFQALVKELCTDDGTRYTLSSLNDFLTPLSDGELLSAVSEEPVSLPNQYRSNYLAATIEYACHKNDIEPPEWVNKIDPLDKPVFASELKSLKLHLLIHSPPPFRRRNIFIDASLGDRI